MYYNQLRTDMMFASFLLLSVIYTCCHAFALQSSDEDVRGISLTKEGNGTGGSMIFQYKAPRPATVFWISRDDLFDATDEHFANGQGFSEITSDEQINGVAYYLPGSSTGYFMGVDQLPDDQVLIPHVEITYPGNEIVYTPNEPLPITVQWTKLPGKMYQKLDWIFFGLDPSVSDEAAVVVSSHQPGNTFLSHVETNSTGQLQETSAELLLQEQSGLVILTAMYMTHENFMVNVVKMLPIHPEGRQTFPDNFLSFLQETNEQYCFAHRSCKIFCLALGSGIESMELLDDEGNRQSEVMITYNNEWMYAIYYKVASVSSKVTRTYTCRASTSRGQEKENRIQIRHNAF